MFKTRTSRNICEKDGRLPVYNPHVFYIILHACHSGRPTFSFDENNNPSISRVLIVIVGVMSVAQLLNSRVS